MKTVGIIAEYNPFHNGHAYQIRTARRQTNADYVIAAMSGDFLQRGEPAVTDKYTRTRMALLGGADLVLELPCVWATASADYFAAGGIQLLGKTGVADSICFGCETADPTLFAAVGAVLNDEPEAFRQKLREYQKDGMSYPLARSRALCALLPSVRPDVLDAFLFAPNNLLALAYERAIAHWNRTQKQPLQSLPIQRVGCGYHDLSADGGPYASARAIRTLLLTEAAPAEKLSPFLAEEGLSLLLNEKAAGRLLQPDAFSHALYMRLLSELENGYAGFADCGDALSHRIAHALEYYGGCTAFAARLKTKNITMTRISRVLLHILLAIRQEEYDALWQPSAVPYLRVLGFRRKAAPLLSAIQKKASVPLLTKPADARRQLDKTAYRRFAQDVYASELYRTTAVLQSGTALPGEYRQPLVIV